MEERLIGGVSLVSIAQPPCSNRGLHRSAACVAARRLSCTPDSSGAEPECSVGA